MINVIAMLLAVIGIVCTAFSYYKILTYGFRYTSPISACIGMFCFTVLLLMGYH